MPKFGVLAATDFYFAPVGLTSPHSAESHLSLRVIFMPSVGSPSGVSPGVLVFIVMVAVAWLVSTLSSTTSPLIGCGPEGQSRWISCREGDSLISFVVQ